jgi:hypothetical protein
MTTITETPLEAVERQIRELQEKARAEGHGDPERLRELCKLFRERLTLERERNRP